MTDIRYYPKINGVYLRHTEGPDRGRFITGAFSQPEYKQLLDAPWYWTVKWDGTSTGILFDPHDGPTVFGKTAKTALTPEMRTALREWADGPGRPFHASGLTVYGELVGPKINGNRHGLDEVGFKPFDVRNEQGEWWAKRRVGEEVPGAHLPVSDAPLWEALDYFGGGPPFRADDEGGDYEGEVGTPDLCDLRGNRIITKLKWADFT